MKMQFAQQAHRDGVPWESAGNVELTQAECRCGIGSPPHAEQFSTQRQPIHFKPPTAL
jgi:hypothetical protein